MVRYFAILVVAALCSSVATASVHLAILPAASAVQSGSEFDVELTVTEAGTEFNGFDAYVEFDPAVLTFIQLPAVSQQGPLMQEACGNSPFHNFQIAPDSTSVSVNYVLLCAGVSVTGPGVIYRLRFRAEAESGTTHLRLLEGTSFYNAGVRILPLVIDDAVVNIGSGTDVPPEPVETSLNLRAAPNPFNPQTVVYFDVPRSGPVSLMIYAIDGHRVVTLIDTFLVDGPHNVPWNGRDQNGQQVAAGIYRLRLEAAGLSEMRSVALVK